MSLIAKQAGVLRALVPRTSSCFARLKSSSSDIGTHNDSETVDAHAESALKKNITMGSGGSIEPNDAASDKYQCGLYYEHHGYSFYDIENNMSSKRVGQPSSKSAPTK